MRCLKKIFAAAAVAGMIISAPISMSVTEASPIQSFQDRVGTDRIAHFGAGYIASDLMGKFTPMTAVERGLAITGLAAIKEATDDEWDNKDFAATILGGLLNLGVSGKF